MQVGINLYSDLPYRDVIAAFSENSVAHTFVCTEHPQFEEAMAALKAANIKVDNFHAPFRGQNRIWSEDDEGEEMLETYLRAVESCVTHGVDCMVAHVSNGRPMPPINEIGLSRFDRFLEYAQKHGVTVAFENHRYVENVAAFMERYPQAGFCLDTSHEHAFTDVRYLPMWGDRLVATHISDNDRLCDLDFHMLPFDGIIDFTQTARELAALPFLPTLMLEVKPKNHALYQDMGISEYYTAAAKSIRTFAALVDEMR